jgi:RNA polymerase sigma factor (sigma-70 family)
MSDGLLLERFVARRDGLAFEAIMARHGPMVISVCRRILPEIGDVEDAFQATFLILVRKAGTLRDRQRLGPWLYGVAHRVATRARVQAARRRSRERSGAEPAAVESSRDAEHRELLAVLDDEINRLPEKYQAVIVLCDLEARTQEEAASQLGCPVGTIKSRLDCARKRLRSRFILRGLAPSTVALGTSLATGSARAAVPAGLLDATVKAILSSIAGRANVTGPVSTSVSTLTEGVLLTMFLSKLKTTAAILLVAGICAAGLGVLAQTPAGDKEDKQIKRLEEQIQVLKRRKEVIAQYKERQDRKAAQLEKLGGEIERGVVAINLVATKVTDDDLNSLSIFPNLQTLHLHHTSIGDAGIANLKEVKSLTTLDLFDTRVTDAGLQHLAEWMPHLEWLELYDTQITDAGLESLKGLKHLRRLDVRKTKVTGAGVEALHRSLPGLEILHDQDH